MKNVHIMIALLLSVNTLHGASGSRVIASGKQDHDKKYAASSAATQLPATVVAMRNDAIAQAEAALDQAKANAKKPLSVTEELEGIQRRLIQIFSENKATNRGQLSPHTNTLGNQIGQTLLENLNPDKGCAAVIVPLTSTHAGQTMSFDVKGAISVAAGQGHQIYGVITAPPTFIASKLPKDNNLYATK